MTPLITGRPQDAIAGVPAMLDAHPNARSVVVFLFDENGDIVHSRYGYAKPEDLTLAALKLNMTAARFLEW